MNTNYLWLDYCAFDIFQKEFLQSAFYSTWKQKKIVDDISYQKRLLFSNLLCKIKFMVKNEWTYAISKVNRMFGFFFVVIVGGGGGPLCGPGFCVFLCWGWRRNPG